MLKQGIFACFLMFGNQAFGEVKTHDLQKEIQDTLDDFANAWNAHDAHKLSEFWDEGGDMISPWGAKSEGRVGVFDFFEKEFKGMLQGSKQHFVVETVRSLSDSLVAVDATSHMMVMKKNKEKEMSHHLFLVMTKKNDKWHTLVARPYMFKEKTPELMMSTEACKSGYTNHHGEHHKKPNLYNEDQKK